MPQRGETNWWAVLAILAPLVMFWVTSSKQTGRIEKAVESIEKASALRDEKDAMQDGRINALESRQSVTESRVQTIETTREGRRERTSGLPPGRTFDR